MNPRSDQFEEKKEVSPETPCKTTNAQGHGKMTKQLDKKIDPHSKDYPQL